jgi:hypothetical protein
MLELNGLLYRVMYSDITAISSIVWSCTVIAKSCARPGGIAISVAISPCARESLGGSGVNPAKSVATCPLANGVKRRHSERRQPLSIAWKPPA